MLSLRTLLPLVGDTLREPRATFRRLLALDLPRGALWEALVLVVILSVLLAEISNLLLVQIAPQGPETMILASPAIFGLMQFSLLVVMVFAIFWVGRAMGGTGGFRGGIILVVWLQFIMVCLQVVQTAALFVMPPLAWLIGFFGLIVFLYLLTQFVAELHGFPSLGRVFGMIMVTMFGFALGLSFLLTLIGVTVPH